MKGPLQIYREWKVKKAARDQQRKETFERLVSEYETLINEYRLIQEKKSTLSKSERDFVVLRIKHLVFKGHIKVN